MNSLSKSNEELKSPMIKGQCASLSMQQTCLMELRQFCTPTYPLIRIILHSRSKVSSAYQVLGYTAHGAGN